MYFHIIGWLFSLLIGAFITYFVQRQLKKGNDYAIARAQAVTLRSRIFLQYSDLMNYKQQVEGRKRVIASCREKDQYTDTDFLTVIARININASSQADMTSYDKLLDCLLNHGRQSLTLIRFIKKYKRKFQHQVKNKLLEESIVYVHQANSLYYQSLSQLERVFNLSRKRFENLDYKFDEIMPKTTDHFDFLESQIPNILVILERATEFNKKTYAFFDKNICVDCFKLASLKPGPLERIDDFIK